MEQFRAGFDVDYCVRRARAILDGRQYDGLEWLDVAQHVARLARDRPGEPRRPGIAGPGHLRLGERDEEVSLLEKVRTPPPAKFASARTRRPGFRAASSWAISTWKRAGPTWPCPASSTSAGAAKARARTLLKLGHAHEQLGDTARAAKYYKQVTAYEGNPLSYEAHDALSRLQTVQPGTKLRSDQNNRHSRHLRQTALVAIAHRFHDYPRSTTITSTFRTVPQAVKDRLAEQAAIPGPLRPAKHDMGDAVLLGERGNRAHDVERP